MATLDFLPLARRVIAIDTTSSLSNLALIEFLLPLCQVAGLETSVQHETRDGVSQYNLLASRRPIDEDTLLLATHTDTVPPGEASLWTATNGDPFSLTQHEGLLYGLGAADVKLDLLCKLLALESVRDVDLTRNVALAATYGEETGRYGAKLLVRELRDSSDRGVPRQVLVGEPTRLRPCTAHKGYLEFRTDGSDPAPRRLPSLPCWRVVFGGVAAHSSQPHRGASANSACLDALMSLSEESSGDRGDGPAIVSIHGGDAVNKVAGRCEAVVAGANIANPGRRLTPAAAAAGITYLVEPVTLPDNAVWSPDLARHLIDIHRLTRGLERDLKTAQAPGFDPPSGTINNGLVDLDQARLSFIADVRLIPEESSAEMVRRYEDALRALEPKSPPHGEGLRLHTERILDSTPFRALEDSRVLAALMVELGLRGLPLEPEIKSGTTEAPVYQEAGMDAIVFGPGQAAGNIHRPNEHVPLADLELCVDIYRDLIIRLCAG